ncbi:hypothetical protein [Rugamonas rubra]|uniref:hypothetical protein n=1 Tax=Rugamonas rubra TaxID=758825 RepID=UPI0011143303|nr:hypothetical protein [Rugamonas rubra]
MNDNLWGTIPKPGNLNTPNSILVTQGKVLEVATDRALSGVSIKKPNNGGFNIDFFIKAESLNNYRYHLFTVTHDVHLYPAKIFYAGKPPLECEDESEFRTALGEILSGSATRKIIEALLAQVRDDGDDIPF